MPFKRSNKSIQDSHNPYVSGGRSGGGPKFLGAMLIGKAIKKRKAKKAAAAKKAAGGATGAGAARKAAVAKKKGEGAPFIGAMIAKKIAKKIKAKKAKKAGGQAGGPKKPPTSPERQKMQAAKKAGGAPFIGAMIAKKIAKKVATKAVSRAIPGLGTAALAHDVYKVGKKMKGGHSFKEALKSHYLGIDRHEKILKKPTKTFPNK